jgi:hypothetical protein
VGVAAILFFSSLGYTAFSYPDSKIIALDNQTMPSFSNNELIPPFTETIMDQYLAFVVNRNIEIPAFLDDSFSEERNILLKSGTTVLIINEVLVSNGLKFLQISYLDQQSSHIYYISKSILNENISEGLLSSSQSVQIAAANCLEVARKGLNNIVSKPNKYKNIGQGVLGTHAAAAAGILAARKDFEEINYYSAEPGTICIYQGKKLLDDGGLCSRVYCGHAAVMLENRRWDGAMKGGSQDTPLGGLDANDYYGLRCFNRISDTPTEHNVTKQNCSKKNSRKSKCKIVTEKQVDQTPNLMYSEMGRLKSIQDHKGKVVTMRSGMGQMQVVRECLGLAKNITPTKAQARHVMYFSNNQNAGTNVGAIYYCP